MKHISRRRHRECFVAEMVSRALTRRSTTRNDCWKVQAVERAVADKRTVITAENRYLPVYPDSQKD
jgi:hypothetical protein